MTVPHFDPFNSRLARDIRNTLSKSFLHSLKDNNRKIFQLSTAEYLKQELEPVYEKYIITRLKTYEEVFAIIARDRLDDVLQQATIFWDHGLYFEMHELLEPVWIKAEGGMRRALQGLIRAAGSKIHLESSNTAAAASMGAKALADLEEFGDALAGFTKCKAIAADLKKTLGTVSKSSGIT